MPLMFNENVLKNLASEICRECKTRHNLAVDLQFVYYMVELLLLNPKYGQVVAKSLNRKKLEFFVQECVAKLVLNDVTVMLSRMQHSFRTMYDYPEALIEEHVTELKSCLRPVMQEIVDCYPEAEDQENMMRLYRKISLFIILCSGLGNPTDIVTLKEGIAALESVFNLDDLKEFVVKKQGEKVSQVRQLTAIVSGCRLFNRDCSRGGEAIPDLPFILKDAIEASVSSIGSILYRVVDRISLLTTAADGAVRHDAVTNRVVVAVNAAAGLTEADYEKTFQILQFYRQYEVILRKVLEDVETVSKAANGHIDKVQELFKDLHEVMKFKTAVPVMKVFPYFVALWNQWREMQHELYYVSRVNQLKKALESIQDEITTPAAVERMLAGREVLTDGQRLDKELDLKEKPSLNMLPLYVGSRELSYGAEYRLEYLGFCAMSLCAGALVPGDPRIGYVMWKGKTYSFCSAEFALIFARNPPHYILLVIDFARENQSVINLLGLWDEVYAVKNVECLIPKLVPKKKHQNKDIQTVIHPIEENIVQNYHWNLWDYKREACHWASIVNCRTHSTQTYYSHMRSEIQCQTTEPRDKAHQTRREQGTSVPTPNTYLWGLRRQRNDKQCVLDLTLPVRAS